MRVVHAQRKPVPGRSRSVYSYVGSQIAALISRFGLQSSQAQIEQIYGEICRESLAFPLGTRPAGHSRINHDGTPFQFSVTLGSPFRSLQFLAEAGILGLSGAERIRVSRDRITAVAQRLQADVALSAVSGLLAVLAPDTDVDLLADPAGAFWIGVAFASGHAPRLKIYTNASWGSEHDRWARLEHFASHFRALEPWQKLEGTLRAELKPLGTAVTLAGKEPPSGRIYLGAYGKRIAYYEALARSIHGDGFRRILQQYAECMLGNDYLYPTQSAVCSFGVGAGAELDLKFELCGHCLFSSDVEAASRLRAWFEVANLDPADYLDVLDILSEGHLSDKAPDLHVYVGVGLKHGTPYSTVYLKPRLIADHEH
jgi:hypothetical protein